MSEAASSSGSFVLNIAVGSTNPVKVNAVRETLHRMIQQSRYDEISMEVEGFDVKSGVAAQPMGDDETQLGAKNRSLEAYRAYKKKFLRFPHLAVGLEGGLEWSLDKKVLWCMAWVCCYGKRGPLVVDLLGSSETKFYHGDKKPVFGFAKTASFPLPAPVTELVRQGLELGDADDKVFNRTNSKQGTGTVGILSGYIINRTDYYVHAIVLALVPWIRADMYPNGCEK